MAPSLVLVEALEVGKQTMAGRVVRLCPCWLSRMCRSVTINALLLNIGERERFLCSSVCVCEKADCMVVVR